MKERVKSVLDSNGGKRVIFFSSKDELDEYMHLESVPMDKETGQKWDESKDKSSISNLTLLLSDDNAPQVLENLAGCFKVKDNPFYDKKFAEDKAMSIIAGYRIEDDVARYISENKMLPDACIYAMQGKRVGKKIVQDNMEFLFGFFRTSNPGLDFDDFDNDFDDYDDE